MGGCTKTPLRLNEILSKGPDMKSAFWQGPKVPRLQRSPSTCRDYTRYRSSSTRSFLFCVGSGAA
jgi:hypothetical protein